MHSGVFRFSTSDTDIQNTMTGHPDFNPPQPARHIMDTLIKNGIHACWVGGAVRDLISGRPASDFDIVTHCTKEHLESLFQGADIRPVGQTFCLLLINGVEVAPARPDPDGLGFPLADLGARDLTINSMALSPNAERLLDPFGGRKDLDDGIIRFTGDPRARILEDPVRMVRACRFAALIKGKFDPASRKAVIQMKDLLKARAAPERLRLEIMKAMHLSRPSLFFHHLQDTGLLSFLLPSLARCKDLDGGPHHGETVFEHCMITGDWISSRRPLLRLAGYLHDTGKFDAAHMEQGRLTFKGHDAHRGAVTADLKRLTFSNREIAYLDGLVAVHMRPLTPDSTPRAVRRLLAFLAGHQVAPGDFMRLRIADKAGNRAKRPYTLREIRRRWVKILEAQQKQEKQPFTPACLALNGHDIMTLLGLDPGPEVGRVITYLFEQVLDDPSLNTRPRLQNMALAFRPKPL